MTLNGKCSCKNIEFNLKVSFSIESFSPRACDCNFCIQNNVTYISEAQGQADIKIKDPALIRLVKQGHELAHFLICKGCRSVICALYTESEKTFAAFNANLILNKDQLAKPLSISPKKLTAEEKVIRWKQLWFPDVSFHSEIKDFYYEGEFVVFTEMTHLKRGDCCDSGCRHCPYKEKN
jgi:hypothetical protein